ncbi:thermonuclease family protein [Kaistia granuli]|uniref:thermonuclease family protein n=1 Tax=Kaistia granuli TaxID=363259 RepID=UPI000367F628|nr:thermonuclease family protein [Kaistia granuli]
MALAIILVSQFGGLDRRELAGLMGEPAPEQVILPPLSDQPERPIRMAGEAPAATMPPVTSEHPEAEPAEPDAPAPRNVTAPGMTPAPTGDGPLEREPVSKHPPAPPTWKIFSPVMVREAGLLDLGRRKVRLAGIVPPDPDRLCHPGSTGDPKVDIPCARLAMVALRSRIRAFGVECRVAARDPGDPIVAPCRIGKTDLALWLVEQGWAEAAANAPDAYAAAETEARCARRGIWQAGDPPADCLQN